MTQFNPADQAATVDAIIRRNRAATGAAVSGLRTRPRMTIAEMNQADPDELRDKYLSDQFDDRGPITKALDLLDLPRNTIVNIAAGRPTVKGVAGAAGGSILGGAAIGALAGSAFGGVGAIPGALAGAASGAGLFGAGAAVAGVARAAGAAEGMSDIVDTLPTGAADQPTVMGADLLKGMGVESGIARGLVGFGLDVAFDPLTYAGPAGWGVNSGRVALRGGAKSVIKSGLREAAGGAARVGNNEIRAMLKAGGVTDEAALTANDLAKLWHGDSTMTKTDKVFRLLGGEEASSGGLLDKLFYTPLTEGMDPTLREGALAARKFVDKYGRGTRGMAIRGGGSEIAHVPFTDIALSVPGFTSEGQRTVAQLRHAKDLRNAAPATPAMLRAADQLNLAREAADTVRASREELSAKRSEWDRRRADLPPDPPPGAAPPAPSPSGPGPGGLPPTAGSPSDVPPAPPSKPAATYDTIKPEDKVTLYRGETAASDANGEWWTTDPTRAAKYGKVRSVTVSGEELLRRSSPTSGARDEFFVQGGFGGELDMSPGAMADRSAQELRDALGEGGDQGSLFGGPAPEPKPVAPPAAADDVPVPVRMVNESDAEYKARLAMHAKWKESARNTGRLFQSAPDPIETRSAIDAEQAAYEQSHRAAMDAAIVAARERLFTIKEEMANLTPTEGANTNTILKFADMRAEAAAAADLVAADKLEFEAAARTRSAVNADINKRIVSQSETLTRLDGYEGALARGENGGLLVNSDPAVQTRVFENARVLMDEIEAVKRAERAIDTATETGKAERETALVAIKGLNEKLLETTAPLREGALQSSDDFIDTLRTRHMDNLNAEAKRLWELADADPDGLDALIEATSAYAEAAKKYYDVIGGTIDAHRSPEFESLHELVKMALGTSDSVVAHSMLGSLRSAVSNIFGDNARGVSEKLANLDAAGRKLFGAKRGSAAHDIAQLHANMARDPMVTATNMLADVHAELDKAMRSANVPMGLVDDVGPLLHLYVYQAAAEKTGQAWDNVFHLKSVKNGKFVDGEMKLALESLEKKFAQNGADFPKLRDSLKQIAAEQVAQIDNLGDAAQQDYLLSFLSPSHVPLAVSQRAQAGLDTKRMAAAFNNAPVGVGPGGSPREGFQHARTTHVYQFTDPVTGEAREFLEKDLWVWGMTDGQLAKLKAENPAAWKRAMAVRESVEMYKRLPNPPPPRPADPWRLNAMVRDGAFDPLNPGDEVPFFETSWPKVFARTTAMHQRAHARQDIVRFMRTHSLNVPENVRVEVLGKHGQMGSKSFTLPNGETIAIGGTMNKNGSIVSRVTARGRSYRYLDPKMLAYDDNPLLAGITDGIRDIMLPEELADLVENHVRVLNDENIGGVLDAIEKATSLFRQTTLFHPSWTISNIIGNFANAAAGDIPLSGLVKNLGTVAKVRMYRHNPEVLKGIKATIGGREYSGPELLALFDKNRMFNDHQPAVEVALLSRSGHVKLPSETSRLPAGQGLKMDLLSGAAQWGKGDQLKAMGTWGSLPWNRIHRQVLTPWFKANGVVEDSFRGAALLARMEQGDDVLAAQKAVQRALFNYADMTQFEQRYMRTAFPFYAWMRNNLAYQFETLLRRPGYIAAVPKTQRAIEEMLAGESRVPPEMRPQWMRSALATQIGSDPDSRFAAVLGQTIPQAELFQVLQGLTGTEGAMDLMKSYVSQLNPVGMVIPQLAARTEFYSGRSIGPDAESGDISAGEFVTGMARPFSEFGMGGKVSRAFDRGAGQGIARSVLGGRVQAFDQDRIETTKLREFKDKENGIRKSIARMDRRGESTLSARASLMRLYDRMVELGFEKDVPVWAREQRLAMREAP